MSSIAAFRNDNLAWNVGIRIWIGLGLEPGSRTGPVGVRCARWNSGGCTPRKISWKCIQKLNTTAFCTVSSGMLYRTRFLRLALFFRSSIFSHSFFTSLSTSWNLDSVVPMWNSSPPLISLISNLVAFKTFFKLTKPYWCVLSTSTSNATAWNRRLRATTLTDGFRILLPLHTGYKIQRFLWFFWLQKLFFFFFFYFQVQDISYFCWKA